MTPALHMDASVIESLFNYKEFTGFLQKFLCQDITVPQRSHHNIPVARGRDGTLLIMPSWTSSSNASYIGVKLVNVFPDNNELPTIQGNYTLMSGTTGEVLCTFDGLALTLKRTAAVSALASTFLSHKDATTLLMIGTGNMCPELIRAHAAVRPINHVIIWGRNYQKASDKANSLRHLPVRIDATDNLDAAISKADIISCATLSKAPLVKGAFLKEGAHVDLVGSFKPDMREADNQCFQHADVFIDTDAAMVESGDLVEPLNAKVITSEDIRTNLTTLCKTGQSNRRTNRSNTIFKSVGFAAPDLAAAVYCVQKFGND